MLKIRYISISKESFHLLLNSRIALLTFNYFEKQCWRLKHTGLFIYKGKKICFLHFRSSLKKHGKYAFFSIQRNFSSFYVRIYSTVYDRIYFSCNLKGRFSLPNKNLSVWAYLRKATGFYFLYFMSALKKYG